MRIAIIGTGISGMTAAYYLSGDHDLVVYEAGAHIGGHTYTVRAKQEDRVFLVDTGFSVYNHKHYPAFTKLLKHLEVPTQTAPSGFSIRSDQAKLGFAGPGATGLISQPKNMMRPAAYAASYGIQAFTKAARNFLKKPDPKMTLHEFLQTFKSNKDFMNVYLTPLLSAIWSSDPAMIMDLPVGHLIDFLNNFSLIDSDKEEEWRVIRGGAFRYIAKLVAPYQSKIRLKTPVESVRRFPDHVLIKARGVEAERFDEVVFATHTDQALAVLEDPSDDEHFVLSTIPYQRNNVILHTDESLITPKAKGPWHFHVPKGKSARASFTTDLSHLYQLNTTSPFCLTMNSVTPIAPEKTLGRFAWEHPVYTQRGMGIKKIQGHISNHDRRTHYCGAYWGDGFHEDGVKSAVAVAKAFGKKVDIG